MISPYCPVCNNSKIHELGIRYNDRYGYLGRFPLLKSSECWHAFLHGEFSSAILHELYSDYYPRSTNNVKSHHPYQDVNGFGACFDGLMSAMFRWVPRNVRVLDIGCGFGESLGYHQARGCEVYGMEADKNIRCVAEKFGFKVHVGLFDPDV